MRKRYILPAPFVNSTMTAGQHVIFFICLLPWGFFAHQHINRMAVYTLPPGMAGFYKSNIDHISEHAVDPDKRRYVDTAEAGRHFIDADRYGVSPFDSIPATWDMAVEKYTEKVLLENGIVPWQIVRSYYALTKAFMNKDRALILRHSSDLGHYISDAHVPLHTTSNYNGQLSGQTGIHAFWESRLPELFHTQYDFIVGPVHYIDNPLAEAWAIVKDTQAFAEPVLDIEAELSSSFPSDRKFTFSKRKMNIERQYSEEYSRLYHHALNGMVERQMRLSILKTGSFWFSAWVDAGQPDLKLLKPNELSRREQEKLQEEQRGYEQGEMIGRKEN